MSFYFEIFFKYLNTVRYLKLSQIIYRIRRLIKTHNIDLSNYSQTRNLNDKLTVPISKNQSMFSEQEFCFLNKNFVIKGKEDWNNNQLEKLWLYNLHYFDDFSSLGASERLDWHEKIIQRWIIENPPFYGNGWEPYPTSLRIVNWIKWFLLNGNLKQEWQDSLLIQTRSLFQNLEYHLLGNHLFSNAKTLIFSGLFFYGEEAEKWYKVGINIINKELSEQVLPDGGNFELSPMYHSLFLEDLLDLINIHKSYNRNLPENIKEKSEQMLNWLKMMSHPDGKISFFNDASHKVAASEEELKNYAKRLQYSFSYFKSSELNYLKDSGYIRLDLDNIVLISDVAKIGPDYLPGHGHADALSFELSLFGKRLIVNSGISTYELSGDRLNQRGTLAHSTVTVDNKNSSETWGSFRVARRAKVFNIKINSEKNIYNFSACHDGYKRIKGSVMHCRQWIVKTGLIEIIDNITGKGPHQISSVLPLHPEVEIESCDESFVNLKIGDNKVKITYFGEGSLDIIASQYHPEFGLCIDNKKLKYDYNGHLPHKLITRISW